MCDYVVLYVTVKKKKQTNKTVLDGEHYQTHKKKKRPLVNFKHEPN